MNEPAVEAAGRVWDGDPKQLAHNLVDSAREALKPIRELHASKEMPPSRHLRCQTCRDDFGHSILWPCATARLVYSEEELS